MKTQTKLFMTLPFLLAAAALFYGCKEDAFDNDGNDIAAGYTYHITAAATAAQGDAAANSKARSLTLDANAVVHSAWETGDKLLAYNLSDNDASTQTAYSLLTVAQAGIGTQHSAFEGNIVSKKQINTNDLLCFLYPGSASTGTDRTIIPVVKKTETVDGNPLEYYETDNDKIKHLVKLDLTQQDGTIATIGKKFDYQWAAARPTAVNGNDVQCSLGTMERKIAIWGLRFKDPDGAPMTDIESIEITNVTASDVLDLGTGTFVTSNAHDEDINITLKPASGGTFSSADGSYVYAALLPGTYKDVVITVKKGTNKYAKTYNTVNLAANRVYKTNVKTAADAPAPGNGLAYVEVQGVKWAKGNFIHYQDVTYGEYWGIAPTQWYISDYQTSQFNSAYNQTANDMDLFRFGDIDQALLTNSNLYIGGTDLHIAQHFYTQGSAPKLNQTTDINAAHFGDIVYRYTLRKREVYAMPTDDNMRALLDTANVMPAFCYTPQGNKIYGAYFWTNNGEARIHLFPTGRRNRLAKFRDVTQLVRQDKGLFLPIAGRRLPYAAEVGYRNMSNSDAYGQYLSDYGPSAPLSRDFFFGILEWNLSGNDKGQAKAIRPVYVRTVGTNPADQPFAPFQGIY